MKHETKKSLIVAVVAVAILGGLYYWAQNSGTPGTPVVKTKPVSAISKSSAVLNGEVNPKGAQTSYWYEYGQTESLGSTAGVQLLGAGYETYQAPTQVAGLKTNTTYYFRLVAVNELGKTTGSILSFMTNDTPPPPVNSPAAETRSVDVRTTSSAVLDGQVNPNGAQTDYWFEFGETTGLGDTTSVKSAGAGDSDIEVSHKISGLEPNTTYYFRLNAQNEFGTTNGNIRSFRTRSENPPPSGDSPSAETGSTSNATQTAATLKGRVNPNSESTTYHFEYGRATLPGIFLLDRNTPTTSAGAGEQFIDVSARISGLTSGATYYYRLVAENEFGTDEGAIESFTTKN